MCDLRAFLLKSGAEEPTIYLLRAFTPLTLFARWAWIGKYPFLFFIFFPQPRYMVMQSKQFVPKYLVDLSRACLAFATWLILCVFRGMPLKASPPATVDLKKSMGRWTVYIHWCSHPLPPTHTHTTVLESPRPSALQHGLSSTAAFPSSIASRVHYPSFPPYVCQLLFPWHPFSNLPHLQTSVMHEMPISSSRLFASIFSH